MFVILTDLQNKSIWHSSSCPEQDLSFIKWTFDWNPSLLWNVIIDRSIGLKIAIDPNFSIEMYTTMILDFLHSKTHWTGPSRFSMVNFLIVITSCCAIHKFAERSLYLALSGWSYSYISAGLSILAIDMWLYTVSSSVVRYFCIQEMKVYEPPISGHRSFAAGTPQ